MTTPNFASREEVLRLPTNILMRDPRFQTLAAARMAAMVHVCFAVSSSGRKMERRRRWPLEL